jgi:hypothetical protein
MANAWVNTKWVHDVHKNLGAAQLWDDHNFLVHVSHSINSLIDILNVMPELQTHMLSGVRHTLKLGINNKRLNNKQQTDAKTIVRMINDILKTPTTEFDSNMIRLYSMIWNPSTRRDREQICDNPTLQNKLYVFGIDSKDQLNKLKTNSEARELFLSLVRISWCSRDTFYGIMNYITPTQTQTNKQTSASQVITDSAKNKLFYEISNDPDFIKEWEKKIDDTQKKIWLACAKWLCDIATKKQNDLYWQAFRDKYYSKFLEENKIDTADWWSQKEAFYKSSHYESYIQNVVKKDIERSVRYADLSKPGGWWLQKNGWKIKPALSDDKKFFTFGIDPKHPIVEPVLPRHAHDKDTKADTILKSITIKDGRNKPKDYYASSKIPVELLNKKWVTITWTAEVKPMMEIKSEMGTNIVFQAPSFNTPVEIDKDELNNLLRSVEPTVAAVAPEVPTVGNFARRTWIAWANVRSAAIPVTWLSAWATVDVHAWPNEFYINAAGPYTTPQPVSNGQQISVVWTALPNVWNVETVTVNIWSEVRTYDVETVAGPALNTEVPTVGNFARRTWIAWVAVRSAAIPVTWLSAWATVEVHAWPNEFYINAAGPYTTAQPVSNGQQISVVWTALPNVWNVETVTVNIWSEVRTYEVETIAAPVWPIVATEVPTVWNFTRRTWLAWVAVRSAAIPVTWLSAWATVEVHAWPNEFYINAAGPYTTAQPVSNGQQISVVWTALPNVWNVETVTVNIWSEVRTYEVETIAAPVWPIVATEVPTVWNFTRRTWLAWVAVRSAAIPVTWLSAWATVEVHAWPNEFYINAAGPYTTPQPVSNGQQISVVWTALPNAWDVETVTVNIWSEVRTYEVETLAGPEILELPTITQPWAFVFSNNPVTVKWTAKADSFVELSDSTGRTLWRVKAVWGDWTLSVWRFPVWNHTLRAVACDPSGTPDPTRFTEISFEVGEVWLQTVTGTRTEINAVVYGETWKQVTIWYRKPWETTWSERSEMMTTNPQTFTRHWLNLTHWTYEVQMKQWTIVSTDTFTIDPHRVLPDMTRLPTSQDRNPVFHGTAEPNEIVQVVYKIPWSKPSDKAIKIPTNTDGSGAWSFTLDNTITWNYSIEVTCAWEKHTINYTSEWISRRPVMDKSALTIKNSDKDFTLSGYIDRRDLDCESVAIFDEDTEIARVPLGKFSMKNLVTRNRSTNSAFSVTLPATLIENDQSKVFTIKPVKHWAVIDKDNISTVTVTKVEDMRNAPREALKEVRANITEVTWTDTPNVTIKWEVWQPNDDRYKIKKVAVWRSTRWTWGLIKRDYQEVNVNDDGSWSLKKTFTNNGKYTYSCAPIIDAEPWWTTLFRKTKTVLWTSSSTTFEVDAERNNQRSKRYNPLSWKRPWGKKKSSSADAWDKKSDKKWADAESETWSGSSSSKWWFFSGLKGLLNGDFLPEPNKSEWKSLVQRSKNIVNGDNDLVNTLEWKKSESK